MQTNCTYASVKQKERNHTGTVYNNNHACLSYHGMMNEIIVLL